MTDRSYTFQTTTVNFHGKKVTEELYGTEATFRETIAMLEASLAEGGIREIIYAECGRVDSKVTTIGGDSDAHV